MLVLELWGLGDLALAMPFLRAASSRARVSLLAKPHAAPLLARFAPAVELIPFVAPWTAFTGKYRLHRWPWPLSRAFGGNCVADGLSLVFRHAPIHATMPCLHSPVADDG